jgi:hypothetical protein
VELTREAGLDPAVAVRSLSEAFCCAVSLDREGDEKFFM